MYTIRLSIGAHALHKTMNPLSGVPALLKPHRRHQMAGLLVPFVRLTNALLLITGLAVVGRARFSLGTAERPHTYDPSSHFPIPQVTDTPVTPARVVARRPYGLTSVNRGPFTLISISSFSDALSLPDENGRRVCGTHPRASTGTSRDMYARVALRARCPALERPARQRQTCL